MATREDLMGGPSCSRKENHTCDLQPHPCSRSAGRGTERKSLRFCEKRVVWGIQRGLVGTWVFSAETCGKQVEVVYSLWLLEFISRRT